ncbi:MAG: hypothetical protein GY943_30375 [Chloroflexi bacterium]|nr:hypothetical protein [Chloroflexota bacterium]
MTDKLRECPWCGGKAKIETLRKDSYGYWCSTIGAKCQNCGAIREAFDTESYTRGKGVYSIYEEALKKAIKAWNARAIDAENKRLRADLEDLRKTAAKQDAEIAQLREALETISENRFISLEIVKGESLDATAAKRLYDTWSSVLNVARAALKQEGEGDG